MAEGLRVRDNYFQVIKNSEIAFDSRRPSIQLFPDSTRIQLTKTISFPNLLGNVIYFNRSADYAGVPMSFGTTYAESWASLIGQEWGPDYGTHNEIYYGNRYDVAGPSTRNLAQEKLATVPNGTTYLDIRARLTVTKRSPIYFGRERPVFFPQEGEWINLLGGSCPVEYNPIMARLFEVILSGRDVLLRRYQSVEHRSSSTYGRLQGYGPQWVSGVATSGWRYNAYGTASWYGAPAPGAWLAYLHQKKGPDINGNKRPPWQSGATNGCAVPGFGGTPWTDFSMALRAELIIHPGRYVS